METSILKSVKKILGISADYTAFDLDIVVHINSVFSVLQQMGVGPTAGFSIEDDTANWVDFLGTDNGLNMVKSYMYLKVRMLFDPPGTSFHLESMNKMVQEAEWRINLHREWMLDPVDPMTTA